jgi:hypothetical protein
VCSSCKPKADINIERQAILAMHNAQRDHHFNKNVEAFVDQFSDNFVSVDEGEIYNPSREESINRFGSYFSSVKFKKWDDINDPIIQISEDGKMAYTVVDKIVILGIQNSLGNEKEEVTHFAWTTIYRKYGNEWKVECVTTTRKPN